MSGSQQKPWFDDPNAPKIPYKLYLYEKFSVAGNLVSAILYGIVIMLFFKCIVALFDPDNHRGGPIRWGLVSYTVAMFSLVTIGTATLLDVQSISYIDNREFPGVSGVLPPGPAGYQSFINPKATSITSNAVFVLSNWLAEGLLLYRCYIIYSRNPWAVVFPCLVYLGSLAMGTAFVYQDSRVTTAVWSALPYYSVSLSFNILLTLMIITRLVLHARSTRNALGITGIGGLCRAVITIFIESCALFTVNSLLVIGPLAAGNLTWSLFMGIIGEIRVIAPLLIILRIANRSALTSKTIASGRISGFKARSRGELTDGGGILPTGTPVSSTDEGEMDSGELTAGVAALDNTPYQDKTQERSNPDALHC